MRDVIEEEMPGVSADERDIWFEELKSLPAEAVRDLLKVRQQMRILSPDHALAGPSRLFPMPDHTANELNILAEPVTRSLPLSPRDWSQSRDALRQAIAWSTHNIVNAATPGYKRIEVVFGDAYSRGNGAIDPSFSGMGSGIKSLRLDMRPGKIKETNRNLDLAIEGEGFLILQNVNVPTGFCYTRCGTVTLDEHGQLCLQAGENTSVLDPPIVIPFDAWAITITVDGKVAYQLDDKDGPYQAGQLHLARFPDPSQLKPIGNGVYVAPPEYASGEIVPRYAPPEGLGMGAVRQGYLEQSNVDVEREQSYREIWESILRALPTDEIPRTASDSGRSQN